MPIPKVPPISNEPGSPEMLSTITRHVPAAASEATGYSAP